MFKEASIENIEEVVALIDSLKGGKLIDCIDMDKARRNGVIILEDPVNYPFKALNNDLIREISLLGEIILINGSVIDPSVKIEPPIILFPNALIGHGCWIRPFSILGEGCKIANTEINRSIICDGVMCMHGDYIGYSYISKNCRIGSGFKTATTIFKGVMERPKNIILRDGVSGDDLSIADGSHFGCILEAATLLGCNTTTMPGTYLRKGRYAPNLSLGGKKPGNKASHVSNSFFFNTQN